MGRNGLLVSEVAETLEPEEAVGITPNPTWLDVAKALGWPRVQWLLGTRSTTFRSSGASIPS
ncbi:MAG: hypothetical protein M3454_02575 [Actinomycetota bacterium]|nr:hypothetical protein [Actinomycetota bacterium]